MPFRADIVLMVVVVGLYLYDSAQLLYRNEALLIPTGKRGWIVGFGSEHFGVLGKELYVPNPFLMHRPLFRLAWQWEGDGAGNAPWEPPRGTLGPLVPLVWSMAAAMFVLLPLGFFTRLGDPMLLLALVLLFVSILIALAWIWIHRTPLRLSRRRFAGLAFESLICPPFALNLVRHITAAMPVGEDLVHAARRLQKSTDWARTRHALIGKLTNELEGEDADSGRHRQLLKLRQTLIDEGESCRP